MSAAVRTLTAACVAATLALIAGTDFARAAADGLTPEARTALARGVDAARQKQWLIALSNFEAAFKLAPGAPEVLFNLALLNDRIGERELRSTAWYRAYLAAAPDAGNRADVEARIKALEESARAGARRLIEKAIAANAALPVRSRTGVLQSILMAQGRIGDGQGGFASIANAQALGIEPSNFDNLYGVLAQGCAAGGEFACIDEAVRRIGDNNARMNALATVVSTLLPYRMTEALAYASRVEGPNRVLAYAAIARAQINAGDKTAARQTATAAVQALDALPAAAVGTYHVDQAIEVAAGTGLIDVGKRLLANPIIRGEKYAFPVASSKLAIGMVEAGLLDEAEALAANIPGIAPLTPPGAPARAGPLDFYWRNHALDRAAGARRAQVAALIKEEKLREADALLSKLPQATLSAQLRPLLAVAQIGAGDVAAAKRSIEKGVAAISAVKEDSRAKWQAIRDLVRGYATIAAAEGGSGNTAAATDTALRAIKAANLIKDDEIRADALGGLDTPNILARTGAASELAKAAEGLSPKSGYTKYVFAAIARPLLESGDAVRGITAARRVSDASTRNSMLGSAAEKRAQRGDWTAALAVAEAIDEPVASRNAYSTIAWVMVGAGYIDAAVKLEPKLAGGSYETSYLSQLATLQARNGALDEAVETTLRRKSGVDRVHGLVSVADTALRFGDRKAAKSILDRAAADAGGNASDRAKSCSYLAGPAIEETGGDGAAKEYLGKCVDLILALPEGKDRSGAWYYALSKVVGRDLPLPRHLAGVALADAQQDSSLGGLARLYAARWLIAEGAIEGGAILSDGNVSFRMQTYSVAARQLWEDGDKDGARRLVRRFEESVNPVHHSWAEVSIAVQDFETAIRNLKQHASASGQMYQAIAVAKAMAKAGRKPEEILALVDLSVAKAVEGKTTYSLYDVVATAAEAGGVARAEAIARLVTGALRAAAFRELTVAALGMGDRTAALRYIKEQESALREADADKRLHYVPGLALSLAWANEPERLEALLRQAPLRAIKSEMLVAAADGYARAGKPEAAEQALRRALEALERSRPDFAEWAAVKIALAEDLVDRERARARLTALADSPARTRAFVELANRRFGEAQPKEAIALMRLVPRSAIADSVIVRVVRHLAASGELAGAHEWIGRIADPARAIQARRHVALIQARAGKIDEAVAEAAALPVEARAYLLADLGEILSAKGDRVRAQLTYAASGTLAETIADPLVKTDLLLTIARGQSRLGPDADEATTRRAAAAAGEIADGNIRKSILGFIAATDAPASATGASATPGIKSAAVTVEERNDWARFAQHSLNDQWHASIGGYMQSLAAKGAEEIAHQLAHGAGAIGSKIDEMRRKAHSWSRKRAAVAAK